MASSKLLVLRLADSTVWLAERSRSKNTDFINSGSFSDIDWQFQSSDQVNFAVIVAEEAPFYVLVRKSGFF